MYKKLLTVSIAGLVMLGCGKENSAEDDFAEVKFVSDTTAMDKDAMLNIDQVVDLLNSVPPPLELAVLIKNVGGEYSSGPLNSTANKTKYTTNFKRALNLGVYGADLGYVNIYSQTQDAFNYLGAVRDLAENLSVGQFFDFETIKKLASSGNNLDELLTLSTQNFAKMNNYLKEQKRVNLSVLMMTGGWVEGLHVACYVAKNHNSDKLNERIGEQKVTLEQIMLLLDLFKNDPNILELKKDMAELDAIFQKVEIKEVPGETVTEIINGIPFEVSQTTTEVMMTPELLNEIQTKTDEIRTKFIN